MTKTKIALTAALFAATSSVAMAQGFDPNMANRYQSHAAPNASLQTVAPRGTFQSAPVHLQNQNVGVSIPSADIDRASSPYAGGGF